MLPRASEALLLDATRAGERLLVAGDYGHILFSDDAGETWTQAEVPTRAALTAIHFPDSRRGWAVGHDGMILASIDGGESWVVQRDGLRAQREINQGNLRRAQRALDAGNDALAAAENPEEEILIRENLMNLEMDLEDAQAVLEEPVNAPPLLDVFFTDEMHGMAVGAFNTLLRTSDGGVSWQLETSLLDNPDEYHLNAITGDGSGSLWIVAEGGLLFRGSQGGDNWQSLESPYYGSWFGVVRAPAADTLLVFGLRGNTFRSEDGGDSWQPIDVGTDRTLAGGMFVNNRYVLLVGAVGTLLVSEDAGMTFRPHPSGERHHLSAVTSVGDSAVLAGQGGVHLVSPFGSAQ